MNRRQYRSFALALLLVAVVFTGGYGLMIVDEKANAVRARATVVAVAQEEPRDTLIVDYTTEDGRAVTADLAKYSGEHAVGATLDIRYLIRDPQNVRLAADTVVEPALVLAGGLLLTLGLVMALHAWLFAADPVRIPVQSRSSWRMSRRPASVMEPDSDG
ncbi:hypothetical protein BLA60_39940 [Actinophytocola xinjiangensis]|uniref:DUF3592 domain-containing protein n=2 Tax=Actinophytocola xinjiangensis TaxID=485602 RepID=A0A7Z0WDQ8_9PSEU|nr:hypothetical protein BLA60_39940 [Actinophytocola xinjiangensis]